MSNIKGIFAIILLFTLCITGCGSSDINSQKPNNSLMNENNQHSEQESEFESESKLDSESELESESETEQQPEETTTMYAQTNVNVRKEPSTDAQKLGMLSTNDKVVVVGTSKDGWQKVWYNGEEAYVSAQYLGTEKVEATNNVVQDTNPGSGQFSEITEAPDLEIIKPESGGNGFLVVIDAGHQRHGNSNKEPDGPGSSTLKAKVTSGTSGCVSGWDEYELNLVVSLKLKDELLSRGYSVAMIRETHEINISNSVRAEAANKLGADAFIRIHANSSTDSSIQGALTICQTASNPYNANLYAECRRLSDSVLNGFCDATGAVKKSVWETDTMSGINWCKIPVTIVEMGFMSNPTEDALMATEEYQNKMVEGMANGIDAYFGQ